MIDLLPSAAAEAAGVAAGARADREARLAPETVTRLARGGLPRHFVPRRHGGTAGSFADLVTRVAAEAESCASAAWCAMLWAWHGRCAAMLPEPGRREIWADSPDVLISAALRPPAGRAEPVGGGWLVSGNWRRVSGAAYADWILVTVADGPARPLILAIPARALTVLPTWDAAGLRATRTDTVEASCVFVPEHRAVPLATFLDGLRDETGDETGDERGGPGEPAARSLSIPATLGGPVLLCAPAFGAARAAIRAWVAGEDSGPAAFCGREREAAHWCAKRIDDAGRLLERAARRADEGPTGSAALARNARDTQRAAQMLREAMEHATRHADSAARGSRARIDRAHRDVHTATSHAALRPVGVEAPRTAPVRNGALR